MAAGLEPGQADSAACEVAGIWSGSTHAIGGGLQSGGTANGRKGTRMVDDGAVSTWPWSNLSDPIFLTTESGRIFWHKDGVRKMKTGGLVRGDFEGVGRGLR